MSRVALIGATAIGGLAAAYWLTKEFADDGAPSSGAADDGASLGNQGNAGQASSEQPNDTTPTEGNVDNSVADPSAGASNDSDDSGGGLSTSRVDSGTAAARTRCHTLHREGHFPLETVDRCTNDMLNTGKFFYKFRAGVKNKYGRDVTYHAPHYHGKRGVKTLQNDWERVNAAGTFCGNVGANGGFPNTHVNVSRCLQSVYDTGRYGPFVDDISMRLLGR